MRLCFERCSFIPIIYTRHNHLCCPKVWMSLLKRWLNKNVSTFKHILRASKHFLKHYKVVWKNNEMLFFCTWNCQYKCREKDNRSNLVLRHFLHSFILLLTFSWYLSTGSIEKDNLFLKPLSANPKTVKHTQAKLTNCLSVFNNFWGLALKGSRKISYNYLIVSP